MSEYYWDTKIDYLRKSKGLSYNEDYLQFLVERVWKLDKPVRMIDFGCGYGYLGLTLLPLLPAGSSYTGIDQGTKLLDEARSVFKPLPYEVEFIQADVQTVEFEREYDLALCHALLLHMPNPKEILGKMIDCLVDQGRVITFETNWIANMASFYLHGPDQSSYTNLGILQKLFEQDTKRTGKDGNVGAKIPVYMSELGLTEIESRVSDKVNVLHPDLDFETKQRLYQTLRDGGIADSPGEDSEGFIRKLMERGCRYLEAQEEYANEQFLSQQFNADSYFTYAPNMKITYGKVQRARNGHNAIRLHAEEIRELPF